jgi:hypothetical protein
MWEPGRLTTLWAPRSLTGIALYCLHVNSLVRILGPTCFCQSGYYHAENTRVFICFAICGLLSIFWERNERTLMRSPYCIRSIEKNPPHHLIRTSTSNLPVCSIVPQLSTLPRAQRLMSEVGSCLRFLSGLVVTFLLPYYFLLLQSRPLPLLLWSLHTNWIK